MKSLKEVQKIVGLDRRTIQEYERHNLAIKPSHTNKYGYLLYDEPEIERLWQLKFYKELGYKIPDIKAILEDTDFDLYKDLETVIHSLKVKRDNLDNLIAIAETMKTAGLNFNSIRHNVDKNGELSADVLLAVLGKAISVSSEFLNDDMLDFEVISEGLFSDIYDDIEWVIAAYNAGKEPTCKGVQKIIKQIHNRAVDVLSESVLPLQWIGYCLEPKGELVKELFEDVRPEYITYIRDAIIFYCSSNKNNPADKKFDETIERIEKLGKQKYATNSVEVQKEVKILHKFFQDIRLLSTEGTISMLKYIGNLIGSDTYKKYLDRGADCGLAWFISRSIELYCLGIQEKSE